VIEKALIQQARQTNIGEYLMSTGLQLKRNGKRYKHPEHDSLIFTDGAYFWNSRQESGNAVDYLTRHLDMTFGEAVEALTGFTPSAPPDTQTAELLLNNDCRRSIAYLNKTRKIDYEIIIDLVKNKLIQQEANTNNAVFSMLDEHGQTVGAELQGTLSDKRFKGVQAGSKYGYGFNLKYGKKPDFIMFFESAVDLLSFVNIVKLQNRVLDDCILVSMCGLKTNIVTHFLSTFTGVSGVFSCVDNDNAGVEFENALEGLKIAFKAHKPDKAYKDWNEQLQAVKT